jgi:hypothetical protein
LAFFLFVRLTKKRTTTANKQSMTSGGGGIRDIGNVTGGMAMMNFDDKTRPYTRQDFVDFLLDYEKNLNPTEMRLVEKGLLATFVGMPLCGVAAYRFAGRFPWRRVEKLLPFPWVKPFGRVCFAMSAASLPYMAVQSWFVAAVLALDSSSQLAFNMKRLMITQRNGMMFARTGTREVTKEEQASLSQQATDHVLSNRMANRPSGGGAVDVNLALGQQSMLPPAQSGYKPMPTKS